MTFKRAHETFYLLLPKGENCKQEVAKWIAERNAKQQKSDNGVKI